MPEMKTVVAGPHGPVPRGDNSRRYIGDEPVEVDLQGPHGAYYARRMMFGDLVEVSGEQAAAARKKLAADASAAAAKEKAEADAAAQRLKDEGSK